MKFRFASRKPRSTSFASLASDLRSPDPRVRRHAHFVNRAQWLSGVQFAFAAFITLPASAALAVSTSACARFFPAVRPITDPMLLGNNGTLFLWPWVLGSAVLFACFAGSFQLCGALDRALRDGARQVYASPPEPERVARAALVDEHFVALFWFESVVLFCGPALFFGLFALAVTFLSPTASPATLLRRTLWLTAAEGALWCWLVARLVRIRRRVRRALGVGLDAASRIRRLRYLWRRRGAFFGGVLIVFLFLSAFSVWWLLVRAAVPGDASLGEEKAPLWILLPSLAVVLLPLLFLHAFTPVLRRLVEANFRRRMQAVRDGVPDESHCVFFQAGFSRQFGCFAAPSDSWNGSPPGNVQPFFPPDPVGAAALYREGAERGDPEAMFALARLLENGAPGVPAAPGEANEWLRRSAALGHRFSVERLERSEKKEGEAARRR